METFDLTYPSPGTTRNDSYTISKQPEPLTAADVVEARMWFVHANVIVGRGNFGPWIVPSDDDEEYDAQIGRAESMFDSLCMAGAFTTEWLKESSELMRRLDGRSEND